MLNGDHVPSIDDAPWDGVGLFRGLWLMSVSFTANMIKPEMFMLSQFFAIFTDEDTDLRDFEIIFMDQEEATVYFLIAAIALYPMMQLESFWFVTTFWYLYAAEFFWGMIKLFASFFVE